MVAGGKYPPEVAVIVISTELSADIGIAYVLPGRGNIVFRVKMLPEVEQRLLLQVALI